MHFVNGASQGGEAMTCDLLCRGREPQRLRPHHVRLQESKKADNGSFSNRNQKGIQLNKPVTFKPNTAELTLKGARFLTMSREVVIRFSDCPIAGWRSVQMRPSQPKMQR